MDATTPRQARARLAALARWRPDDREALQAAKDRLLVVNLRVLLGATQSVPGPHAGDTALARARARAGADQTDPGGRPARPGDQEGARQVAADRATGPPDRAASAQSAGPGEALTEGSPR